MAISNMYSRCVDCLRVMGFGKGSGPRGTLPRNDCLGMTVWKGRTRGKVMIPASPAKGFPGLSFSRRCKEEQLEKLTRNGSSRLWRGVVFPGGCF